MNPGRASSIFNKNLLIANTFKFGARTMPVNRIICNSCASETCII